MQEKYNKSIPGWISEHDLAILSTIAGHVPLNGNILEIGSFVGRSTTALFLGKNSSVTLTVVDPFTVTDIYSLEIGTTISMDGDPVLIKKIKELAKQTNSWHSSFRFCVGDEIYNQLDVNVMLSRNYRSSKNFDLVFLDGSHTTDDVILDIVKFLKSDTLIIGDDFSPKFTSVAAALALVRKVESRYLVVHENSKLWMLIPTSGYWKEFFKSQNVIQ